jgi:Protein of unknown function (DUF3891)
MAAALVSSEGGISPLWQNGRAAQQFLHPSMIVRPGEGVLHLVTQPDHAALAYRIMNRWQPLAGVGRRASILLAIQEHDNGWREPDAAPSVDPSTGRIFDFITLPTTVRQAVWPRGIARLSHDPWAAALVAHHALTVYDRFRSNQEWSGFFTEIEATRAALVRSSRHTLAELADDYVYLRIGDLVSLIFCNRWKEPQEFGGLTMKLDGERVAITPGPPAGELPITVTAREIADTFYASDAQLREALRLAPAIALSGVVAGPLSGDPDAHPR